MILIDDMEMPKNCKECQFMYQDTGELNNGEEVKVYMCSARSQGTAEKDYADKRSEWCPLHEVIDTDTVSRQAAVEICFNGWNKNYREIAQDIKDLLQFCRKAKRWMTLSAGRTRLMHSKEYRTKI